MTMNSESKAKSQGRGQRVSRQRLRSKTMKPRPILASRAVWLRGLNIPDLMYKWQPTLKGTEQLYMHTHTFIICTQLGYQTNILALDIWKRPISR